MPCHGFGRRTLQELERTAWAILLCVSLTTLLTSDLPCSEIKDRMKKAKVAKTKTASAPTGGKGKAVNKR